VFFVSIPSGAPRIRNVGTGFLTVWGCVSIGVILLFMVVDSETDKANITRSDYVAPALGVSARVTTSSVRRSWVLRFPKYRQGACIKIFRTGRASLCARRVDIITRSWLLICSYQPLVPRSEHNAHHTQQSFGFSAQGCDLCNVLLSSKQPSRPDMACSLKIGQTTIEY